MDIFKRTKKISSHYPLYENLDGLIGTEEKDDDI